MRLWRRTGQLPVNGGMDAQPAARITHMLLAEQIYNVTAKKKRSGFKLDDLTVEDRRFMFWLSKARQEANGKP